MSSIKKDSTEKSVLELIVETPSTIIDLSVQASKKTTKKKPVQIVTKYFKELGPGLTTGAADDDPSGIATYSQTGAQFGTRFLWASIFSLPFMAAVQEMCGRIGLVTGVGLAGVLKRYYSKYILYFCTLLLLVANTVNIGANIGAMAASAQLLTNFSFQFLALFFALFTLVLQIFVPYHKYAKFLKFLTLSLFTYIAAFFLVEHDWSEILQNTFLPKIHFDRDSMFILTAILGTTISPYLFFWEASQEVERDIDDGLTSIEKRKNAVTPESIKKLRKDVVSGMSFSNIVMFFIIGLTATTLYKNGITNIATASDAAEALRPIAGDSAYLLFSAGIIGTGMLAIPVLAGSASYALSETFGWRRGLNNNLHQAKAFYGVIIISVLIGLSLNYFGVDPIKALIYTAVLNGLIAPILIFMIVSVSANAKVMGQWKNSSLLTAMGLIIGIFMSIVGIYTIFTLIFPNI